MVLRFLGTLYPSILQFAGTSVHGADSIHDWTCERRWADKGQLCTPSCDDFPRNAAQVFGAIALAHHAAERAARAEQ